MAEVDVVFCTINLVQSASTAISCRNVSLEELEVRVHLGNFRTPIEAHKAWQMAKKEIIYKVAQEQPDERLKDALILRCNQLQYDIDNGLETVKL